MLRKHFSNLSSRLKGRLNLPCGRDFLGRHIWSYMQECYLMLRRICPTMWKRAFGITPLLLLHSSRRLRIAKISVLKERSFECRPLYFFGVDKSKCNWSMNMTSRSPERMKWGSWSGEGWERALETKCTYLARRLLVNRRIPPNGVSVVKPGTVVGICFSYISRHSISQRAARELKNVTWSTI